MSVIPETLVIGVFLHGELHMKDNGELNYDIVPDGMRVTVINAVAPGVQNISTLQDYEIMAEKISLKVKTRKNYDKLTKSQIKNLSESLRDMLLVTNKNQATNIIKEHQYLYSRQKVNPIFGKFSYQYGNSFKIKTHNSGDYIPDKIFIKFSEGEVINPNNIPEYYFNKIILHNLEGEPDLFEMLETVGMDIEQIRMEQLMEFLVNLGVKNLTIVDLSCSVFNGDEKFLSDRNIRQLRRNMLCI